MAGKDPPAPPAPRPDTDPARIPPPHRKPRWRRWLRALALVGALLLLLLAALPTILSNLPLEGAVERRLSGMLEGDVHLEGLRLGWFAPLALDGLTLRAVGDAPSGELLRLRGLRIGEGLLPLLAGPTRPGRITIESLEVHLVRDEDGVINVRTLLPPRAPGEPPAAPPADPAEPFILALDSIFPVIPLPLEGLALDFELAGVSLFWEDGMADGRLQRLEFLDGSLHAKWGGGGSPLTVSGRGTLASAGESVAMVAEGQLNDWTDGKTIRRTPGTSLRGRVAFKGGGDALGVSLSGTDDEVSVSTTIQVGEWLPVLGVLGFAEHAPRGGTLTFSALMGATVDGEVPLRASFLAEDLLLPKSVGGGEDVIVPPVEASVEVALHESRLAPSRARADLKSPPLRLAARMDPADRPEHRRIDVTATALPGQAARLLGLPPSEGSLEFRLSGKSEGFERFSSGAAELHVRPGMIVLPPGYDPPLPLRRGDRFDATSWTLSLTTGELHVDAEEQRGSVTIETTGPERIPLKITAAMSRSATRGLDVSYDAALGLRPLWEWLDSTFLALPPLALEGGDLATSATLAQSPGGALATALDLRLDDLVTSSPLLPGGRYADQIEFRSNLDRSAEGTLEGSYRLYANYLTVDGNLLHDGLLLTGSEHRLRLPDLERLQRDFPVVQGDPPPFSLAGSYGILADVSQTSPNDWLIGWSAGPEGALRIGAGDYIHLEGEEILLSSGRAHVGRNEEKVIVRLEDAKLDPIEGIALSLTALVTQDAELTQLSADPLIVIGHGPLLDLLFNELLYRGIELDMGPGETRLAGNTRMRMGPDADPPLLLESGWSLSVKGAGVNLYEPLPAALSDFNSSRTISLRLAMQDGETSYTVTDLGDASLGHAWYGDQVMAVDLFLKSEATLDQAGDFGLLIRDAGWEGMDVVLPGGDFVFLPMSRFHGRLSLTDSGDTITLDDLTADIWDRITASLSGAFQRSTNAADFHSLVTIADLAAINRLLGDMVPAQLEGGMEADVKTRLSLPGPGDAPFPVKTWDARLDVQWNEFATATTAAGVSGTTGSLRIVSDPSRLLLRTDSRGNLHVFNPLVGGRALPFEMGFGLSVNPAGEVPLWEAASVVVEDTSFTLPDLGARLALEASLDAVSFRPREGGQRPAPILDGIADAPLLLNQLPGRLAVVYQQDAAHLTILPGVGGGSGDLGLRFDYHFIRDVRGGFLLEGTARDLALQWGEGFAVEGLRASLPLRKSFYLLPGIPAPPQPVNRGSVGADSLRWEVAGRTVRAEGAAIEIREDRGFTTIRSRMEELLGGPFSLEGRVEERLGVTALVGTFSLTGMDAAVLFPVLEGVPASLREVDCFGSVRIPYRLQLDEALRGEGLRPFQLLEDVSVRLDVSRMEAEVLRGALRTVNATGGFPGAQAVLAALQFSRPAALDLDLRAGLVNTTVEMVTPGGLRYRIPLIERLHVGDYLKRNLDTTSRLASDLLTIFVVDALLALQENYQARSQGMDKEL